MSDFERANARVTDAVYRFDRAMAEAVRAAEDMAECERDLADHPESSAGERAVAERGDSSARVALAVLRALQFEPIEQRPVHVPARTEDARDVSDCECAIPAKPPNDHGVRCPVYRRWAAQQEATARGRRAEIASRTVDEVERANALIVSHRMPWCRARLLHALGAAEEQGVLDEVLRELLDDSANNNASSVSASVRNALRRHRWSR